MVDLQVRPPRYRATAVVCVSVLVVATTLTWVFLGMRAVMGVGGACADGGPYVSAQPCPDAAAVLLSLGIPVMLLAAFAGTFAAVSLDAPNLLLPMWAFLFTSLGWNFLEHGLFTDGIVWSWLVCGVLFEAMGLPALYLMLPIRRSARQPPRETVVRERRWVASYLVLSAAGIALALWTYRAWS